MSAALDLSVDRWWMVRAEGGTLQPYFRSAGIVAAGSKTPRVDFTGVNDVAALRARLETCAGGAAFVASSRLGAVVDFVLHMREGDIVVTPSPNTTNVLVRTIEGPYEYHPSDAHGLHLHRRVKSGTSRDVNEHLRKALSNPQIAVFRLPLPTIESLRALVTAPRVQRL